MHHPEPPYEVQADAHHFLLPADRPRDRADAVDAAWSEPAHREAAIASLGGQGPRGVLLVDVWVFDPALDLVLLVEHRRRGWVMPGGKVEPGETAREAAVRELSEETGVTIDVDMLAARPADVRWSRERDVGLSYVTIVPPGVVLIEEHGQRVAWHPLAGTWESIYPHDGDRLRREATHRRDQRGMACQCSEMP